MLRMRLAIVSHVVHYRWDGELFAYAPYAREIEMWADLFEGVLIAAPCRNTVPAGDCALLGRHNISIVPQPEVGGEGLRNKLGLLWRVPGMMWGLARTFREVDAIHVRCPGNLGLLGALMGPLFSPRLVAKYAGQWTSYPGEPSSVRLQRRILRSRWWHGPVTVYGHWPGDPPHIIPFFTSVLSEAQIARARAASGRKGCHRPLRLLYVGRLSAAKNVDTLLEALRAVRARGHELGCTIVGDGPERGRLQLLCKQFELEKIVDFAGGIEFDHVLDFLEESDALVLASETEGWPKALAEAMAFGLICVGSNRGLIPQMLADGRGFVVPPRDAAALTEVLAKISSDPEALWDMRQRAAAWAQRFALDGLKEALRALLESRWGVAPDVRSENGSVHPIGT
jgi:glycosyltransferase involved in cell wall biosynthesis